MVTPEDVQAGELLIVGWVFGVMTCLLYVSIKGYAEIKLRNRRHQRLLNQGHDPLEILRNESS